MGEAVQFFTSRNTDQQVVYALIYRGVLSVDLTEPLTRDSVVRLSGSAYAGRKVS